MCNMKETFGQKVRYLRCEKELSQIQLAIELGVGKSVISLWELDKVDPTLSNLVKIAKYFGVSVDYLAGLDNM